MKTEIVVREKTELRLSMPAGVWTRTGFTVSPSATEAQLHSSVALMTKLNRSTAWALGDLGIEIHARKRCEVMAAAKKLRQEADALKGAENSPKRDRLLKKAEELESKQVQVYTRKLADALGVDDGYWRNCISLARFFNPSQRSDTLTPAHHLAAMRGAGGTSGKLAKAKQWIAKAQKDSLSASELRKKVNLSLATSHPPSTPPEKNAFTELDAADQWCIRNKELAVAKSHAQTLLVRWQELFAFGERLRKLAADTGNPHIM